MNKLAFALALVSAAPVVAQAKEAAAGDMVSMTLKAGYEHVKKDLVAAADEMPAADYDFKPTPEIRSFGQIIAHVADAQYHVCANAKGEASPYKGSVEKQVTGKDALKKALAEAFAYCDGVYGAAKDAEMGQPREIFGMKMNKLGVMNLNVQHDNEHYGMIVVYLRLKKLVPPSSKEK